MTSDLLPLQEVNETDCLQRLLLDRWSNSDCIDYYNALPIKVLKNFAKIGGFSDGCDINLIYPFILKCNSILEVGAGYGRVLKSLKNLGYQGRLYAIERCVKYYQYMKLSLTNEMEIFNDDFRLISVKNKVDAVLWMWSNISEHPKCQQLAVLKKSVKWLNNGGTLVIETISPDIEPMNVYRKGQNYIAYSKYGVAYGYTPTRKEVLTYAQLIKLELIKYLPYKTLTGRERVIYVFVKK